MIITSEKPKIQYAQGVHVLTNQEYQQAAGISKGDLDLINISPAHYQVKDRRRKESPALIFGTLFHSAILEPEDCRYYVKPQDMSFATKDGKAWRAEHSDLPIITGNEFEALAGMTQAVKDDPEAQKWLSPKGVVERSLFYHDDGGFIRKCRPDWMPEGLNAIVDLKSTECASPKEFAKSIFGWRYHVQAAWYIRIAQGIGLPVERFIFIAVEKEPPYAVAVYELDEEVLNYGKLEAQRNWAAYVNAQTTGDWNAYGRSLKKISLPEYLKKAA